MSHFECCLNWRFWRSKKVVQVVQTFLSDYIVQKVWEIRTKGKYLTLAWYKYYQRRYISCSPILSGKVVTEKPLAGKRSKFARHSSPYWGINDDIDKDWFVINIDFNQQGTSSICQMKCKLCMNYTLQEAIPIMLASPCSPQSMFYARSRPESKNRIRLKKSVSYSWYFISLLTKVYTWVRPSSILRLSTPMPTKSEFFTSLEEI